MENSTNRTFYKLTDEDQKHYLKNKSTYTRFIIRINKELIANIKELKYFENFNTCCKASNAIERDRAIEYDFDVMDYDNSQARDMIANHAVVICYFNDRQIVMDLLKNTFGDNIIMKSGRGGKSITTHIGTDKASKGIWHSTTKDINKYPICIVSLSRANNKSGYSHLLLTKQKIKHYIFVEPKQYEEYNNWINHDYCQIIIGDRDYSKTDKMGSTPMRNNILRWAKDNNNSSVWMLDDNIKKYDRMWQGEVNEIEGHDIFTSIENYVDRYDNVGIVSHNFAPLVCAGDARACIVKNGKCYSSMLIRLDTDIIFRYKHQEDNLISIEFVCKGYCNLCFNHIQYHKDTSGINKGGNHEEIYKIKKGTTDGDGYQERYEYFECILRILYMEHKLKLQDGKGVFDLLKRDTTMQSKKWHAKVCYDVLEGAINELIKKPDYKAIKPSILKFVAK